MASLKFIPISELNSWKFKELNSLGGYGIKLICACNDYIEESVNRDASEQLKGVRVTIKDLDSMQFDIGSGLVSIDSALGNMIKVRIENRVVEVKRQILGCLRQNGIFEDVNISDVDTILKDGTHSDKMLANSIKSFVLVGSKIGITPTREMLTTLKIEAQRVRERMLTKCESELFNASWFNGYITKRISVERNGIDASLKRLNEAMMEFCITLHNDRLGIDSVAEYEKVMQGAVKRVCCVDHIGRRRVATKSEIECLVGNLYFEYANIVSPEDNWCLTVMLLALSGDKAVLNKIFGLMCNSDRFKVVKDAGLAIAFRKGETVESVVSNNVDAIINCYEYIKERVAVLIVKLRNGLKELEYPDSPLDKTIKAMEITIPEMVTRILKERGRVNKSNVAFAISDECYKKDNYLLSEKQAALVRAEYARLKQLDESGLSVDAEKCVEVATELLEKYKDKCDNVVVSIAESTLKKGSCSIKQFDVINKRLRDIKMQEKFKDDTSKMSAVALAGEALNISTAKPSMSMPSKSVTETYSGRGNVPVPVFGVQTGGSDIDALGAALFGSDE